MEMIQPNRLKQAEQELQTINFSNGFEIPEEIKANESKIGYICIGVKARDSSDGFSKIYNGYLLKASLNRWHKMKRQIEQGVFKKEFADMFDKIVLLHDPSIKPKKTAPKPKALSPKHKKAVNELVEEGKTVEEMAAILEIEVDRIKAYLA
jgi:DNA-binding NarL/FixJ family response regulator